MSKGKLVIGVIGDDCHSVGNQLADRALNEYGFDVTNLRVMNSQDEFIDAAIETGADAILVSSIYGHADIDCLGFRDRCTERGLKNILLYVGGNLIVGKHEFSDAEAKFKAMGFDYVIEKGEMDHALCRQIELDIIAHNKKIKAEAI